MATKPSHNGAKKDSWQPKGFVNLYLSEAQLAHAFETYAKETKVESDWNDEMANGYRFTFSYDGKTGSVLCTVNCKDESSENFGWLLSSFAPSWKEALVLSLYKHLIVLECHWGNNETSAPKAAYG